MAENNGGGKSKLLKKTSGFISDNSQAAKEGAAYYLDTLRKLPGAYMTGRGHIKASILSRRIINSPEDIRKIKNRIDGSKSKITSIKEWVGIASQGNWDENLRKTIEGFGLESAKFEEKMFLLETDYNYFIETFLTYHEDDIQEVLSGSNRYEGIKIKKEDIADSLDKIEMIGDKVDHVIGQVDKLEKGVEVFVDNKLSGSIGKGKKTPKRQAGKKARDRGFFKTLSYVAAVVLNNFKIATLGFYYIARIAVFLIKYFILFPAAFIEKIIGRVFKRDKQKQI